MSDTQTAAGTERATDTHPAREVKAALTGFLSEFAAQHAELRTRVQQQEERLTMLDRKHARLSSSAGRPSLSTGAEAEPMHRKAFAAYLRSGADEALRGVSLEGKAMRTSVNAEGGFLVDPETAEAIQGVLHSAASIRAIANVVTVEATSFDVLVDHSELGTGWATEAGPATETGTPLIDRISIPLHELSAMPKASQRLLDDAAFDIEGWLAGRIADRFARAEAAAFISGDGVDKPKGFLNHLAVANTAWQWGRLGYVPSGAAGAFKAANGADAIVDLVYALDAPYRAGAVFVMNSKTAGAVRKMKDGDGRFLWSDGLAAAEPARLMGYPVLVAEDMPDIGAGAHAIAFGDFRAGYTIAERPDLRVLRDPFSAKPHVLFYATRRVGGDVSDFKAIKLLRFATS
ncbi:phage major capsid protein [Rhodobaculum claviforme]|uniref:Phage major capsid protein n=1 Tax=Rhodobaculum claviforme TaxID=1549854 RepID=A0A934TMI3_9RHOB|nr:phage major capsid protein [Rhodobaculum claviforme]MBK5928525.1 phage major capsid protein [Rhodobaculum claviforme]